MRMKIFLAFLVVAGAGFFVPFFMSQGATQETARQPSAKAVYYCPMHPQITADRKGACPICGMDLVKKEDGQAAAAPVTGNKERRILFYRNPMNPAVTATTPTKDSMGMDYVPVYEEEKGTAPGVLINAGKQQMIGVKKDTVMKRPLAVEISTVGKVAYDPDLYVAQEEYIQALKTVATTENSVLASIKEQSAGLLTSAERKLLLLGMSKAEVQALKNSGVAQDGLYFPGNSGKAWIYITIYEYELGLVKEGQEVSIDAVAFPGEIFKGKIIALTPILNAESRSVRVRTEVDDKDGKLKPEMFVNARISVDLGEKLSVPEEAVMDSGMRKIVYVVKDDRFALRKVTLGPKAGEFYEVLAGLEAGEEVVTSGNFLIDAESKLKGAL
ncbi:MAG: efflux RND transporter periplasmic adaptor subunit [Candidatus Omnitrophica bacterium]|nr:efflux RND transporter periplasmic adaptor subunit [Candidatus Omnitrophota bacterium]